MSHDSTNSEGETWYSRTIFSVSSVEDSLHHYCELLGFEQSWKYEEKGKILVAQVNRGDCELILTENLDRTRAERVGAGRVFVSLNVAEMAALKKDIIENQIKAENINWGYPTILLSDPDGNELLFPQEEDM